MDAITNTIDKWVDQVKKVLEGRIDFEGQKKAERWNQIILISNTILSFVVGYLLQSMVVTFTTYSAGLLVSLLVVVPPWSCYRQHPVDWLPAVKDRKMKTSQTG